jgi:post-segregation antitoxin (ccd killing protein)
MPETKKTFGNPNMIRFDAATKRELEQIARTNGLSVSALVRLAVADQMPRLKRGATHLKATR